MIELIIKEKSSVFFYSFFLIGEYNTKKRRFYTYNVTTKKNEVYDTKKKKKE
jgi:hypothetical protein